VSITFDDGYANNREVALPILAAKGMPATVFVAPGFLDGGRMFNDSVIEVVRRAPQVLDLRSEGLDEYRLADPAARIMAIEALLRQFKYLEPGERIRRLANVEAIAGVTLPADLMMTSEQVRELHRAGIEIGAHTVDHPILTSIDDRLANDQMVTSKKRLEELIGAPVKSFAYPNGAPLRDYDGRHVAMARDAGFDFALSTAWGSATADSDVFQIPRVAPWDRGSMRYGLRLARAYAQRKYRAAQS
jgi:peptidoglycan/xylan/chitin deacetylase (PgdA/CDA1 family)